MHKIHGSHENSDGFIVLCQTKFKGDIEMASVRTSILPSGVFPDDISKTVPRMVVKFHNAIILVPLWCPIDFGADLSNIKVTEFKTLL